MTEAGIMVHLLTPERWPDLERLFGERGAYSGCWCMFLRLTAREFDENGNAGNRLAFRRLVEAGPPPGLLAYVGGEPAGWIAVAPRAASPRLDRSPVTKPLDGEPAWAVTCFFIDPAHRRHGVARALLEAGVRHAAEHGARALEAYPRDTSTPVPAAEAWRGTTGMFEAAGFEVAVRRRVGRPLMRRWLVPLSPGDASRGA